MKKILIASAILAAANLSAHAQLIGPRGAGGALIGGIAGGIIGHNTGHRNTGAGIAIGAGAGLLLGTLADHDARRREAAIAYSQPVYVTTAPATVLTTTPVVTQSVQQPQQVTVVNNYYPAAPQGTMSGANALFGR